MLNQNNPREVLNELQKSGGGKEKSNSNE
jgi:hypothetical protein